MADFNPDEYLAEPDNKKARNKFTAVESGLVGAGQGVTMGFGDEILGALGAFASKSPSYGGSEESTTELYRRLRDKARAQDTLAKADNPKSYIGGSLGGSAATALIPGLGIAKGATLATGAGKAALAGGLVGAGESEADLTDPIRNGGKFVGDVAMGAGLGGVTQGVMGTAAKGLGAVTPSALRKLAETRAAKAVLGNNQKSFTEASARPGGVRSLGRSVLDEGIVTPLASHEAMLARASSKSSKYGAGIGNLLDTIDEKLGKHTLKGTDIADDILTYRKGIPDVPQNEAVRESLRKQAQYYSEKGAFGARDLQDLKNSYKYDPREQASLSLGKEASNEMKKIVGGNLEKNIDKMAPLAGADVDYAKLKEGYGAATTAKNALKRQVQRDTKNRLIEPSTYMSAAGAAAGGAGGLGSIGIGAANKAFLRYGNQLTATGADKAAAILEKSPEILKEFAGPLSNAMQKSLQSGGPSFAVTHQLLMKNPRYKQIIEAEKTLNKGDNSGGFNPDSYLDE